MVPFDGAKVRKLKLMITDSSFARKWKPRNINLIILFFTMVKCPLLSLKMQAFCNNNMSKLFSRILGKISD